MTNGEVVTRVPQPQSAEQPLVAHAQVFGKPVGPDAAPSSFEQAVSAVKPAEPEVQKRNGSEQVGMH